MPALAPRCNVGRAPAARSPAGVLHPSPSRRAMIPTDPPAGDPPAAFLDRLGEAAAAALRA
ncbi:MAG TPA: hypothetical protein VHG51_14865, partial [Longimicrobiaceae bacterium]|nr:hypothetical protein [Longimicrobiaceae bacterium]